MMVMHKFNINANLVQFENMAKTLAKEVKASENARSRRWRNPTVTQGSVKVQLLAYYEGENKPAIIAEVHAESIPTGASLIVWVHENRWPDARQSWELLLTEMRRRNFAPQPISIADGNPQQLGQPTVSAAAQGREPLGSAPIDPNTRKWEFEKQLLSMWTPGNNTYYPFPLDALARTISATPSPLVKVTLTLRDDGIRRYRLESGDDVAELSMRASGNQTVVIFTPLGQCRVDTPAGDALHNFVAGAIWWADFDHNRQGSPTKAQNTGNWPKKENKATLKKNERRANLRQLIEARAPNEPPPTLEALRQKMRLASVTTIKTDLDAICLNADGTPRRAK